jgi:hypothetical protein
MVNNAQRKPKDLLIEASFCSDKGIGLGLYDGEEIAVVPVVPATGTFIIIIYEV